jgi:hypothetical protein
MQYKEDIKNLMKKSADMDLKATNENRDLTEPEILFKNEILDAVEELNKSVQALERQEKMSAMLEKPETPQTIQNKKHEPVISVGVDNRSKEKFSSLGQNIMAVINAARPGGHVDPRLYNAASGLNETMPSEGGFLV